MTFNKAATKTADFKKRILARARRPIAEELAKRNALGVNRRARTARAWPGALPDRGGNRQFQCEKLWGFGLVRQRRNTRCPADMLQEHGALNWGYMKSGRTRRTQGSFRGVNQPARLPPPAPQLPNLMLRRGDYGGI